MNKNVKRYTLFASLRPEAIAFLPDEVVSARDYDALLAERDAACEQKADWVKRAVALGESLDTVTAERDRLLAEIEELRKDAEWYRLVKHGESPAEYPTEGKLDD